MLGQEPNRELGRWGRESCRGQLIARQEKRQRRVGVGGEDAGKWKEEQVCGLTGSSGGLNWGHMDFQNRLEELTAGCVETAWEEPFWDDCHPKLE